MGTITVTPMSGITWTIDGTVVTTSVTTLPAADHTYQVVATAGSGYDFGDGVTTRTFGLVIAPATDCGTVLVATPVAPEVTQSSKCGVQGSYTIPTTAGLTYLLDGTAVSAGTHQGPVSGTITAKADTGWTLADPSWSFALAVTAAKACTSDVPPAETTSTTLPKTGLPTASLATAGALALLLGLALMGVASRRPVADPTI